MHPHDGTLSLYLERAHEFVLRDAAVLVDVEDVERFLHERQHITNNAVRRLREATSDGVAFYLHLINAAIEVLKTHRKSPTKCFLCASSQRHRCDIRLR